MSDTAPPGPPGPPPGWRPPPPPPPAQAVPTPVPAAAPARGRGKNALVVGLSLVAALLVVAAAVVAPGVVDDLAGDGSAVAGGPARSDGPDGGDGGPDLDDVLLVEGLSPEHRVDEDIDYEQVPPIGGPHDQEWLACGAYDEPVRDENAVHDLEHGTVWITYDPALEDAAVAALEAVLPDDGILSPYPDLPASVVVTVWGAQLRLSGPDDPRLQLFLDEYGDGSTAPEAFASCEGGTDDPQGGPDGVAV